MTNEEQYLIDKLGRENPFRVPDGYFDTIVADVMAHVDSESAKHQQGAKIVWLRRPAYWAAACICALFVSVTAYFAYSDKTAGENVQAAAYQSVDHEFEEAADYAMVDNMDIYACLSAE